MTLTESRTPGLVISAGPGSHTFMQYMDFVETFNFSLNLSTVYFILLILVGVELPFVYSCYSFYSILECCYLFSRVKLSIISFCFVIIRVRVKSITAHHNSDSRFSQYRKSFRRLLMP